MNTKRNSAKQRMNNDARTNSNVQEIGDSIYSKFNANAQREVINNARICNW
ncbi:hypothetical protein [Clostridium butyricum]